MTDTVLDDFPVSVYNLTWGEVDPSRHPFVDKDVFTVASVGIQKAQYNGVPIASAEQVVSKELTERYGRWAVGWRWSQDTGGPISNWCCVQHSWSTPTETASRITSSLLEWRSWLEELRGYFEGLTPPAEPANFPGDALQRALATLITAIVERTGASDAWYFHCEQVLSWYLQYLGVDAGEAPPMVAAAVGGIFESWTQPDLPTISQVGASLAARVNLLISKNG